MRVLVVEDEPFIALDLQMLVEAEGHDVVGIADSFDSAIAMAFDQAPDAAFLDLNLTDGMTGLRLARVLTDSHEIPVVFVTGNAEQIPPDFAGGVGVVDKPFTHQGVAELLLLIEHRRGGKALPQTHYARVANA